MKPSGYVRLLGIASLFALLYFTPVSSPSWVYAALVMAVAGLAMWLACGLVTNLDDDVEIKLSEHRLEQLREMHLLGDG